MIRRLREREHERGFDAGYAAAIHDARVPGSRAHGELETPADEQGYNGWRGGYPTWCCALWIGNDPAPYELALNLARVSLSDEHPRATLADALKEWIRGRLEPDDASLAADLLGYALDGVDWMEIADGYLETARYELTDEDEDAAREWFTT